MHTPPPTPPQPQPPHNPSKNPALAHKLATLSLPLAPLVRLPTGEIHPAFPKTLLSFHVLTSAQLDDLAHFYHQRSPSEYSARYPCPVMWGRGLSLEEKRRKMGRFIGLRGCESPVLTAEEIERRGLSGFGGDGDGDGDGNGDWKDGHGKKKESESESETEREMWRRKLGGFW